MSEQTTQSCGQDSARAAAFRADIEDAYRSFYADGTFVEEDIEFTLNLLARFGVTPETMTGTGPAVAWQRRVMLDGHIVGEWHDIHPELIELEKRAGHKIRELCVRVPEGDAALEGVKSTLTASGEHAPRANAPDTSRTLPVLPAISSRGGYDNAEATQVWVERNMPAVLWFLSNHNLLAEALAAAGDANLTVANARDSRRYRHLRSREYNGFPVEGRVGIGKFEVKQKLGNGEAHYLFEELLDEHVDARIEDHGPLPVPVYRADINNCSTYAKVFQQKHERRPTAHEYFTAGIREGKRRVHDDSIRVA